MLLACDNPTEPEDMLEVSVRITPSVLSSASDVAEIRVVARNTSGRALRFESDGCYLTARVEGPGGDTVFDSSMACLLGLRTVDMAPGDFIANTFSFSGWDKTGTTWLALPAGTYTVRGGVTSAMRSLSPPATFEISD
jgi:hypothetical protein